MSYADLVSKTCREIEEEAWLGMDALDRLPLMNVETGDIFVNWKSAFFGSGVIGLQESVIESVSEGEDYFECGGYWWMLLGG